MTALRIGIYGGTFNPIHYAHLVVAQTALESLNLTKIVFVPSGIPPLKTTHQLVSGEQRLAMVRLAIADNPNFELTDFEVRRNNQKSFTIDTVQFLTRQYPTAELFFILGDDCVEKLHRWKDIDELQQLVQFVCVNRVGASAAASAPAVEFLTMPALALSSSLLREHLKTGKSIRYLTPKPVEEYIERHGLYGDTPLSIAEHAIAEHEHHE